MKGIIRKPVMVLQPWILIGDKGRILSEVKGELSEIKNVEARCKLKIITQKQR